MPTPPTEFLFLSKCSYTNNGVGGGIIVLLAPTPAIFTRGKLRHKIGPIWHLIGISDITCSQQNQIFYFCCCPPSPLPHTHLSHLSKWYSSASVPTFFSSQASGPSAGPAVSFGTSSPKSDPAWGPSLSPPSLLDTLQFPLSTSTSSWGSGVGAFILPLANVC